MYAREKSVRPRPDSGTPSHRAVPRSVERRSKTPSCRPSEHERETSARTFEDSRVQQLNAARDRRSRRSRRSTSSTCRTNVSASAAAPQAEAMVASFNPHAERPTFATSTRATVQHRVHLPLASLLGAEAASQRVGGGCRTKPLLQHLQRCRATQHL